MCLQLVEQRKALQVSTAAGKDVQSTESNKLHASRKKKAKMDVKSLTVDDHSVLST